MAGARARGHPRHPSPLSRKLRALHIRALRRPLRGSDRMLRRRLAHSKDVMPRCRQGRGAVPQGVARAGGPAEEQGEAVHTATSDRPPEQSEVFTYHSPGDIIPGTGFRRKGGVADYTVYSRMRFPIAEAPAFPNSQSFMNWGNCEATGRTGAGKLDGVSAYRCRVSGQTLIADESARTNYSYPWRDNFCEHRNFYVGQCPGGLGHQGQDIRPASCKQRIQG